MRRGFCIHSACQTSNGVDEIPLAAAVAGMARGDLSLRRRRLVVSCPRNCAPRIALLVTNLRGRDDGAALVHRFADGVPADFDLV